MAGYSMVHVDKAPVKLLQCGSVRDASSVTYRPDDLGNIQVTNHDHINALADVGWAIYGGPPNQTVPVSPDQLIWPNKVSNLLSPELNPYERIVLAGLEEGGLDG
ncbi:MAG: hypothetical protein V3S68_07905 [Dehalococcoidia bacterium]